MSRYYEDWAKSGKSGLIEDFNISENELNGVNIIFAAYTYESYSGDAFVLFLKDGKLYEVNGSHCSCYGLEGQWHPEETSVEAIKHRLKEDYSFSGYRDHLENIIDSVKY